MYNNFCMLVEVDLASTTRSVYSINLASPL